MARITIEYGIDLGTTNSAIARMENGESIIKKSPTQKDTTPSCVAFNKKKATVVGDKGLTQFLKEILSVYKKNDQTLLNTFIEFKRTMGTDEEYNSKHMGRSYLSEELSAEVLKSLKSYIRDEDLNSIVITVPAKFQGNQNDATMKAAQLAGFQHCILLQEPIAASMAYGIDTKDIDGKWLVSSLYLILGFMTFEIIISLGFNSSDSIMLMTFIVSPSSNLSPSRVTISYPKSFIPSSKHSIRFFKTLIPCDSSIIFNLFLILCISFATTRGNE